MENTNHMKHFGTVKIEMERLFLRKFTENDVEVAFKNGTKKEALKYY